MAGIAQNKVIIGFVLHLFSILCFIFCYGVAVVVAQVAQFIYAVHVAVAVAVVTVVLVAVVDDVV
jgi:hypothetical protein